MRYATCETWAEWLEKNEGVSVSADTIRNRLCIARVFGISARHTNKRVNKNNLFAESDVRRACVDHLGPNIPVCDEDSFTYIDGIRYSTIGALTRLIGVSKPTISHRLASSGIIPIRGKMQGGQLRDLYPEPQVRGLCIDLLDPNLIQVGEDGFIIIGSIRYGTIGALARLLGISSRPISSRLACSDIVKAHGKDTMGHPVDLWPEPAVRELCASLLDPGLPCCDEDGFVDIGGVRHGTKLSLAPLLGISHHAISYRLASSGIASVRGKAKDGNLRDLYPEPRVRELCKDVKKRKKPNPKAA